ncbi:MAG: MFS transporter [Acutalibacteraceae bacterium]|nr:MFS transporter [Acutalibacteraceae bacterium]
MGKLKEKFQSFKNNPDVALKEQVGYVSGVFGNCMGQDSVGTYTDQFMYDYMGLNSGHIVAMKSVTTGVNILIAPIVGILLDNNRSGKGNARRFMMASAIPFTLSSILLFVVPSASLTFNLLWSFILYLTFNIADTFFDVALSTLSVRMTPNAKSRKNFYTVAQIASTLGSMLPGGLVPIIIDLMDGDYNSEKWAFFSVALLFGVLGLFSMLVPCMTLKERNLVLPPKTEKKVKIDYKLILLNRPLLLLSLSQCVDSIRQVCYNSLPFFYKQTLNNYGMKTFVEAGSATLSYGYLLSIPFIGKKLSSRDIVVVSYLHTGICYLLLALFGYKNLWIVGILIALGGLPNAGMNAARRVLLADSTDYMEWKSYKKYGVAQRNEGMVFAFNTMVSRISALWKELLVNGGLALIGYQSAQMVNGEMVEAVQTPETLHGIFLLVAIPGIIGNLLPALIMSFDNFTGKRKEKIMAELEEIRAESKAQLEETQTV